MRGGSRCRARPGPRPAWLSLIRGARSPACPAPRDPALPRDRTTRARFRRRRTKPTYLRPRGATTVRFPRQRIRAHLQNGRDRPPRGEARAGADRGREGTEGRGPQHTNPPAAARDPSREQREPQHRLVVRPRPLRARGRPLRPRAGSRNAPRWPPSRAAPAPCVVKPRSRRRFRALPAGQQDARVDGRALSRTPRGVPREQVGPRAQAQEGPGPEGGRGRVSRRPRRAALRNGSVRRDRGVHPALAGTQGQTRRQLH